MVFYIRANAVRFYAAHLGLSPGVVPATFLGWKVVVVKDEEET